MFRALVRPCVRPLSQSCAARSAYTPRHPISAPVPAGTPDLRLLKFDSNGQQDLYAVCKIHNIPYLVTKGDKLVLPYKIRHHEVGDVLRLTNVTTIGSRNFTYNRAEGIPQEAFELTATLTEITKEPKWYVYKKKPRCRRLKTVEVEPFQTHMVIDELKLT